MVFERKVGSVCDGGKFSLPPSELKQKGSREIVTRWKKVWNMCVLWINNLCKLISTLNGSHRLWRGWRCDGRWSPRWLRWWWVGRWAFWSGHRWPSRRGLGVREWLRCREVGWSLRKFERKSKTPLDYATGDTPDCHVTQKAQRKVYENMYKYLPCNRPWYLFQAQRRS